MSPVTMPIVCSMVDDNVVSVYNRCPFVIGGYAVNVAILVIGSLIWLLNTSHWFITNTTRM